MAEVPTNLTKLDKSLHIVSQPGHWQTLWSNRECIQSPLEAPSAEGGEFRSGEATEKHIRTFFIRPRAEQKRTRQWIYVSE